MTFQACAANELLVRNKPKEMNNITPVRRDHKTTTQSLNEMEA